SLQVAPGLPTTLGVQFLQPLDGVPFQDWSIVDYPDLDPTANSAIDFRGTTPFGNPRTHDDIMSTNYAVANFARMDAGLSVLAAAPGVVSFVQDYNNDRQTVTKGLNLGLPSNVIRIDHGGGWETEYSSLMNGSVAVKVGDLVRAGQLIGLIGSSGDSNYPHLGFAVRHNGLYVDPDFDPTSYFVNPLPYQDDLNTSLIDIGITSDFNFNRDQLERPVDHTTFSSTGGQNA